MSTFAGDGGKELCLRWFNLSWWKDIHREISCRKKGKERSITQMRGWSTTALPFECSHKSNARRKYGLPNILMYFAAQQKSSLDTNYRSTKTALPFPSVVGGEWGYILQVFPCVYKKFFLSLLPSKFEKLCLIWNSTYRLWENILDSQPWIVAWSVITQGIGIYL